MLTIDGSLGEGGGQILRTSLSLAALSGQQVTIENIRANRDKPGLRPQHLTGALAVADICGAEVDGARVGSTRLIFRPHDIRCGEYEFDVSRVAASAGSVNLIFQTILWPLAFAQRRSRAVIKGGTHVPFAPSANYISDTFLPAIAAMGIDCRYEMVKAGYYPAGGGEVRIEVNPVEALKPLLLTHREDPIRIELTSGVSNLPAIIAERQMKEGANRISRVGYEPSGQVKTYPSSGKGTVFFISAKVGNVNAGFQSLGAPGKPAEKVAAEACDEFRSYLETDAMLDKHLADQLIIPIALARGASLFTTCEITQHLLTNIAVVEQFLNVHFHVSRGLREPGTVERTGA